MVEKNPSVKQSEKKWNYMSILLKRTHDIAEKVKNTLIQSFPLFDQILFLYSVEAILWG